jgi:hypothetical protein
MIEDFINPVIRGGKIVNISLIVQQDSQMHHTEYHGLVTIVPDTAAVQAIKKLHRKCINGKFVSVSEYHYRFRNNDPRLNQSKTQSDKRRGDRRRKLFNIAAKVTKNTSVRSLRYSKYYY